MTDDDDEYDVVVEEGDKIPQTVKWNKFKVHWPNRTEKWAFEDSNVTDPEHDDLETTDNYVEFKVENLETGEIVDGKCILADNATPNYIQ